MSSSVFSPNLSPTEEEWLAWVVNLEQTQDAWPWQAHGLFYSFFWPVHLPYLSFTLACVLSRKERQAHSLIRGKRFSKPIVATYKSHIPQSGFYHWIKLVFSFLCHISQMVVNIKGEDRGLLTGSLKAKHKAQNRHSINICEIMNEFVQGHKANKQKNRNLNLCLIEKPMVS